MFTDDLSGMRGHLRLRLFHALRLWRRYERWLDPTIAAWLALRPGSFVDVGAHIGAILLKVKELSPGTRCLGFEPSPAAWLAARSLIQWSRLAGCEVFAFGLSRRAEMRELFSRPGATDSAASLVEGFRAPSFYARRQWVVVLEGDDVLDRLRASPVSLVKIDVEGAEVEVLEGLGRTLAASRPGILCEILPAYDIEAGVGRMRSGRQDHVQEILSSHRYRMFRFDRSGGLHAVTALDIHSDLSRCDYFFVPDEDASLISA